MLAFTPVNTISQGQVDQAQGTYNQDQAQSQQVLQNLQDYQKNMQSGTDMYNQQLQGADQWAGYDPARLQQSLANVAQTQKVLGGLPQAVQAQNAGTGATAGNIAGSSAAQAGNLNTQLTQQTAGVQQNQATQQAALTSAQQGTQAGQTGQQLQLQGYQTQYQSAQAQLTTAQAQLQSLNQLFQQQGQFNSDQARQYQQMTYLAQQADAAMRSANASYLAAQGSYAANQAQAAQTNQQIAATQAAMNLPRPATTGIPKGGGNTVTAGKIPANMGNIWNFITGGQLSG